jgi:RNA polymerase sigma-70 factor (ECF subfamily)
MFFTLYVKLRLINRKAETILIDRELIEECRKGDFRNFRKVVATASPFSFSVAFRMVGDEDIAKDIVQETMVTIWEKIGKIKSPEAFTTWLYRITVNKCYDHLRKRKINNEVRADDKAWAFISDHFAADRVSELENNEIAMMTRALTERLSPKQKAVFILSDLNEMTPDEISEITGLSKRNIKANLHYARMRIGELIEKHI